MLITWSIPALIYQAKFTAMCKVMGIICTAVAPMSLSRGPEPQSARYCTNNKKTAPAPKRLQSRPLGPGCPLQCTSYNHSHLCKESAKCSHSELTALYTHCAQVCMTAQDAREWRIRPLYDKLYLLAPNLPWCREVYWKPGAIYNWVPTSLLVFFGARVRSQKNVYKGVKVK